MDTFLELQTTLQSDLTVDSNSTLYSLTTIKSAINRAYRKAGGLYRWPELEDAKKTSTVSGQEYYDYPQNWRPDSMWKLTVDDEDYGDPLVFKDYLYEKENSIPSGADKLWASQWRRFFIYPTPTTNGDNNLVAWGVKAVSSLSANTDVTIFSYAMPACNEAIVLEAGAILRAKGEDNNGSAFKSQQAKEILSTEWQKVRQDATKYESTTPFMDVPDYFGGSGPTGGYNIGNF